MLPEGTAAFAALLDRGSHGMLRRAVPLRDRII